MALFTQRYGIRPLLVALILRSIYHLGIGLTLNILGALNVSHSANTELRSEPFSILGAAFWNRPHKKASCLYSSWAAGIEIIPISEPWVLPVQILWQWIYLSINGMQNPCPAIFVDHKGKLA